MSGGGVGGGSRIILPDPSEEWISSLHTHTHAVAAFLFIFIFYIPSRDFNWLTTGKIFFCTSFHSLWISTPLMSVLKLLLPQRASQGAPYVTAGWDQGAGWFLWFQIWSFCVFSELRRARIGRESATDWLGNHVQVRHPFGEKSALSPCTCAPSLRCVCANVARSFGGQK